MKDIVVIGSSGLAREIGFLINDINKKTKEWNFLGYVDNHTETIKGTTFKPIMNDNDLLVYDNEINVVIGVGFPNLIKKLANKFSVNSNITFPNLVHPNFIGDMKSISMGKGNIITAGNIFTVNIKLGAFNIFNLNGTVGHDTEIGSYNVFNPTYNISGGVKIANSNLIGTGSQVLQDLTITTNNVLGAGAVLTKEIIESGVYVGMPAKKIK